MRINLPREKQKEVKKEWTRQYRELEKIVNEWDPVGLIRGGAPDDEYDCLTTQILYLLHKGKNAEELREFILAELDEHFGYGLNCIRIEYRDKFLDSCNSISLRIEDWFNTLEA